MILNGLKEEEKEKMDETIDIIAHNEHTMPDEQGSEVLFSDNELAAIPTLGDNTDRMVTFKEEPEEFIIEEDKTLEEEVPIGDMAPPV
jgi:hypothetical protein